MRRYWCGCPLGSPSWKTSVFLCFHITQTAKGKIMAQGTFPGWISSWQASQWTLSGSLIGSPKEAFLDWGMPKLSQKEAAHGQVLKNWFRSSSAWRQLEQNSSEHLGLCGAISMLWAASHGSRSIRMSGLWEWFLSSRSRTIPLLELKHFDRMPKHRQICWWIGPSRKAAKFSCHLNNQACMEGAQYVFLNFVRYQSKKFLLQNWKFF